MRLTVLLVGVILAFFVLFLLWIGISWQYVYGLHDSRISLFFDIYLVGSAAVLVVLWVVWPSPPAVATAVLFCLLLPDAYQVLLRMPFRGPDFSIPVWTHVRNSLIVAVVAWLATAAIRYARTKRGAALSASG